MGKTIIISERQLNEILGADSSYLDNMEGDFKEFNADIEVSAGGKLSNKTDSKPITGDEYTSMLSKTYGFNGTSRHQPLVMNCSTDKKKY